MQQHTIFFLPCYTRALITQTIDCTSARSGEGSSTPSTFTLCTQQEHLLPPSPSEAGSDPRGHLGVTWGVYLCAGKPPLADIILSHPPDLTRCDSVIGLAIPAMSGHIQYRGAAS